MALFYGDRKSHKQGGVNCVSLMWLAIPSPWSLLMWPRLLGCYGSHPSCDWMFSGCGRSHLVLQWGFITSTKVAIFTGLWMGKIRLFLTFLQRKHQWCNITLCSNDLCFSAKKVTAQNLTPYPKIEKIRVISPGDYAQHVVCVIVAAFDTEHVQ